MADLQQQARNCYDMAYFALPKYVFGNFEKLDRELASGRIGAIFFYFLTCKVNGMEPEDDVARSFAVHSGMLDSTSRYHIIQYPTPPPVPNVLGSPDPFNATKGMILCPYFSAVIINDAAKDVKYYVLGQNPIGQTTLRGVSDQFNANLGPGCDPKLEPFLELLRTRDTRKAIAGVGKRAPADSNLKPTTPERVKEILNESRSSPPRVLAAKRWWQFWK